MTDLTRKKDFAEKKTISVSSARLQYGDIADTTLQELFNLPENCLITDAGIIRHTAGQAGLTVAFGFAGGTELGAAVVMSAAGYIDTAEVIATLALAEGTPNTLTSGTITKGPRILTTTGKNVTVKFSATPTAGDFTFIVSYIEFDLGNGKMTNYTA